jgi:4-hydroxythreonine-4-phosphate dehydrogenase
MMKKSRKYNSWNFNRDLNGIGSEVVLKTRGFSYARALYACYFCQCENNVIHKKEFRVSCPLHGIDKLDQIVPGKINVLNL